MPPKLDNRPDAAESERDLLAKALEQIEGEPRTGKGYCRSCGYVSGHSLRCPVVVARAALAGEEGNRG